MDEIETGLKWGGGVKEKTRCKPKDQTTGSKMVAHLSSCPDISLKEKMNH